MLRIICILLLFSFSVCGQVSSGQPISTSTSAAPTSQYTAADTVAALHRLFRTRRAGGYTLLATGIVSQIATPVVAGLLSTRQTEYGPLGDIVAGVGVGFVIALPITILSGNLIANNSVKKENTVVALYQETHVLPTKIAKKLMPRYFLPAK